MFGHLKRSKGLGKTVLEGRIDGERKEEDQEGKGQRERDIWDAFNKPITDVGRLALDGKCFKDTMSAGRNS